MKKKPIALDEQGRALAPVTTIMQARIDALTRLLGKLDKELCTGAGIYPGSEEHRAIFIHQGHGLQEWLDRGQPWC